MKHRIMALLVFLFLVSRGWAVPPPANVVPPDLVLAKLRARASTFFPQVQGIGPAYDSNGYMFVDCPGCSGVSPFADNSSFTVGSTGINLMGAYYTSGAAPTLSTGNAGRIRMDANSYLFVDCVTGCAGGATTPTDAFATPTTAGLSASFGMAYNGASWDLMRSGDKNNVTGVGGVLNTGPLGRYNATQPTLTDTRYNMFQLSSRGELLVSPGVSGFAISSLPSITIANTSFGATQGTSPWVSSISTWASGTLGAMANYGTSPGAVLVPGVNAYVTSLPAISCSTACEVSPTTAANTVSNPFFNTLTDNAGHANTYNSNTTSSKYGADTNILSILGTAPTTAGFFDIKGADGNVFVRQATGTNLHAVLDTTSTTAVTQATGTNLHAVLDSTSTTAVTQATGTNLHVVTDATSVLAANQSVNVSQINAHTTTECGVNGCLSVGGNIADGSALTSNNDPIVMAGKGSGNARVPVVCDNWAPFSLASTTALKIITLASSKNTYICSINIVSASANNVALIDGTKNTNDCDTATHGMAGGTTAAAGWNFAANGGLAQGTGIGVIAATVTVSHDVCLLASGSGQVSGVASYTQF